MSDRRVISLKSGVPYEQVRVLFEIFDIVKAGLAGSCTPVDLNISIQMIASYCLGFSPGMGHQC